MVSKKKKMFQFAIKSFKKFQNFFWGVNNV